LLSVGNEYEGAVVGFSKEKRLVSEIDKAAKDSAKLSSIWRRKLLARRRAEGERPTRTTVPDPFEVVGPWFKDDAPSPLQWRQSAREGIDLPFCPAVNLGRSKGAPVTGSPAEDSIGEVVGRRWTVLFDVDPKSVSALRQGKRPNND
jgi:hypothetical protein